MSLLSLRINECRDGVDLGVGPDACKELAGFFSQYLLNPNAEFPFDVAPEAVGHVPVAETMERLAVRGMSNQFDAINLVPEINTTPSTSYSQDDDGNNGTGMTTSSTLLPPLRLRKRGEKKLILNLKKIGIKDAATGYIDCFATISVVKLPGGILCEVTQDTPVTFRREEQHIVFDTVIHVQTPLVDVSSPLHDLTQIASSSGDVGFILELKHFKPKKNNTSTKGWAFFKLSELQLNVETQRLDLEVYAKPTDLKCRKMSLLSVKELYAQIDVITQTE